MKSIKRLKTAKGNTELITQATPQNAFRMSIRSHFWAIFCVVASIAAAVSATAQQPAPTADEISALLEKGRALAEAGDCDACHTKPGGKPFAGGYAVESPMGRIWSTNITPSRIDGIGAYSEAQFAASLRQGIRADGAHLYPAMPYTAYTLISDADIHALYAYFMRGVAPVDEAAPATELKFPFNIRASMRAWNWMFLDDQRFRPDQAKSAEWNRGAYLVTALEHCSACHSPRGVFMGERSSRAFGGAPLGAWYAPNITSDPVSGIGAWSEAELVQYFRTGRLEGRAQAAGGMAEAVEHSLQHLPQEDLHVIAVFLKAIPGIRDASDRMPRFAFAGQTKEDETPRGGEPDVTFDSSSNGATLYSANCASCHQRGGAGSRSQYYPNLHYNTAAGASNANNLVAAILYGVDRRTGKERAYMPGFGVGPVNVLKDPEIAAVANYVLEEFGNPAAKVTADDVTTLRRGGPRPLLVTLASFAVPGLAGGVLGSVLLILWLFRWRKRPKLNSIL